MLGQALARQLEDGAPGGEPGTKYLRALDIETGKIVWEIPLVGPIDGKRVAGILGTAGGLLFYGDPSGYFVAVDERDGKTLWRIPLNATIKTFANDLLRQRRTVCRARCRLKHHVLWVDAAVRDYSKTGSCTKEACCPDR